MRYRCGGHPSGPGHWRALGGCRSAKANLRCRLLTWLRSALPRGWRQSGHWRGLIPGENDRSGSFTLRINRMMVAVQWTYEAKLLIRGHALLDLSGYRLLTDSRRACPISLSSPRAGTTVHMPDA